MPLLREVLPPFRDVPLPDTCQQVTQDTRIGTSRTPSVPQGLVVFTLSVAVTEARQCHNNSTVTTRTLSTGAALLPGLAARRAGALAAAGRLSVSRTGRLSAFAFFLLLLASTTATSVVRTTPVTSLCSLCRAGKGRQVTGSRRPQADTNSRNAHTEHHSGGQTPTRNIGRHTRTTSSYATNNANNATHWRFRRCQRTFSFRRARLSA